MNPSRAMRCGSYRFRPSTITGRVRARLMRSKSGFRYSSHSVTIASAAAPSTASYTLLAYVTRSPKWRRADASAAGSCTRTEQLFDQHECGTLAHIVGLGLEREPPDGDRGAVQPVPQLTRQLFKQHALLPLVRRLDRVQDVE